jgi:hypothetical protein
MLDERTAGTAGVDSPYDMGLLLVDEEPTVLALYHRDDDGAGQVVAWVLALPGGDALLMPIGSPGGRPVLTTLGNVRRRWAALMEAELVQVAGRRSLRLAS